MVFYDFHDFWQKLLQSSQKSSFGGWARPKKRRSSPSGDRKVVSGVIFQSADMFRADLDTHFSWPRSRLEPAGASQSEIPKPPPYLLLGGGGGGCLCISGTWGLGVSSRGLAQEKCMSVQAQNMSADKNTTSETTFLPPDGVERRFLGLAHPSPLLFGPFWSIFGQNPQKTMKNHEKP